MANNNLLKKLVIWKVNTKSPSRGHDEFHKANEEELDKTEMISIKYIKLENAKPVNDSIIKPNNNRYIWGSLNLNRGLSTNIYKTGGVGSLGVHFYSTKQVHHPKKKIINDLKIAWNIPVLPDKILIFHNNIIIRIFRVIGGISVIIWLGKFYGDYNIIVFPLAMLHFIYIIFISFTKMVYIVYSWRNGKYRSV